MSAVLVGEDLDLDMTRTLDVALEEYVAVAEGDSASRRAPSIASLSSLASRTIRIPLPPPPAEALTRRGRPISASAASGSIACDPSSSAPGTTGTPASCIIRRASTLDPIASIASAGGPIQTSPGGLDRASEVSVLGQKSVTGVHRVRPGAAGRIEHLGDIEVGLGRADPADRHGLIGVVDERRLGVGLGVDRNCGDPLERSAAEDPAGDLPAVRDQQLADLALRRDRGDQRCRGRRSPATS